MSRFSPGSPLSNAFYSDGVTCLHCFSSLPWFNLCRGPGTDYEIIPYCPICGSKQLPGVSRPEFTVKRRLNSKPVQLLLFSGDL